MSIIFTDWVGESTATLGTGDITLGGTLQGFAPMKSASPGSIYYTIVDGLNKETGIGTFDGNITLERTTIVATLIDGILTHSGSPLDLSGNAQVFGTVNSATMKSIQDRFGNIEDLTPEDIGAYPVIGGELLGPAIFKNSPTGIHIDGGDVSNGSPGDFRYNPTLQIFEGYYDTWKPMDAGYLENALRGFDGVLNASPSWADVPNHDDPNLGDVLDAQAIPLVARTEQLLKNQGDFVDGDIFPPAVDLKVGDIIPTSPQYTHVRGFGSLWVLTSGAAISGEVISFVNNNDYGTATLILDTGEIEVVTPYIKRLREQGSIRGWGVGNGIPEQDTIGMQRAEDEARGNIYYDVTNIYITRPIKYSSYRARKGGGGRTILWSTSDFDDTETPCMFINKSWGTVGGYLAEKEFIFKRFVMNASGTAKRLVGIGSGHTTGGRVRGVTFRNFGHHATDVAGCDDFDIYDCKSYGTRGVSTSAFQFDQAIAAGLQGIFDDGIGCRNSGVSGKCYAEEYTYVDQPSGQPIGSMIHFHRNNHSQMYAVGFNKCRNCDQFLQSDANTTGHADWTIAYNQDLARGSTLGATAAGINIRSAVDGLTIVHNSFYQYGIGIYVTDYNGMFHSNVTIHNNKGLLSVNSLIYADMMYYGSIIGNKEENTANKAVDSYIQVGGFYVTVTDNTLAKSAASGIKVIKNRNGNLSSYITIGRNKILSTQFGVSADNADCNNLTLLGDDIIGATGKPYNIVKPISGMNNMANAPQQYTGVVSVAGFTVPAGGYLQLNISHDFANSGWYAEVADIIKATVTGLIAGVYVDGAECVSANQIQVTLYNRNGAAFSPASANVKYVGTKMPVLH